MAPADDQFPSPQAFRDHPISILWKRRWTIVASAAVVMGAALFFSLRETPMYTSDTTVLVSLPQQSSIPVTPDMETERKLVSSPSVAQLVISAQQLNVSTTKLLAGLSVSVPADTTILDIAYSAPSPTTARQLAQAFGDAYLQFRRDQYQDAADQITQDLDNQIATLNDRLNVVEARHDATTDPGRQSLLESKANSLNLQIAGLNQQLQSMTPVAALSAGQTVGPAELPTSPSSPNHIVDGILGLFLGLAIGVGLALLQEYFDDRVRSPEELEARLGAGVIGAIPRARKTPVPGQDPVPQDGRDPEMVEAFRALRTDLVFAVRQRHVKSVLVTSCVAEEGKTLTVASLGEMLVLSGKRVAMLSADLRAPRLETWFGVEADRGLVDVLLDEATLADVAIEVREGLTLIPSGPPPGDPVRLLASDQMPSILEELGKNADLVLIDSPPLIPVADARVLAATTDAVLFVVDARTTTRARVAEARSHLDRISATILGIVMRNAQPTTAQAYQYGYSERSSRTRPAPDRAEVG